MEIGLGLGWKVENNSNGLRRNGASFYKFVFTFKHWLMARVQKQSDLNGMIKAVQLIIGL